MIVEKSHKSFMSKILKDCRTLNATTFQSPSTVLSLTCKSLGGTATSRNHHQISGDTAKSPLFTNPLIISPKEDTVKLVLFARHLDCITDLSSNSCPLGPVQTQLTRIDGKFYRTINLPSVHKQVLFRNARGKTNLIVSGIQYMFERVFFGQCCLPNTFIRIVTIQIVETFTKKQAINCIHDVILQARVRKSGRKKVGLFIPMIDIIRTESAPLKPNFSCEKFYSSGTFFLTKKINQLQKIPKLEIFEQSRKKRDSLHVL